MKRFAIFKTIRFRMTAGFLLILLASLLFLSVLFYQNLKLSYENDLSEQLKVLFRGTAKFISINYNQRNLIVNELNQLYISPMHDIVYAFFDSSGNILAKSRHFAEDNHVVQEVLKTPQIQDSLTHDYQGNKFKLLSGPVYKGDDLIYVLQVGSSLEALEAILEKYRNSILFAIPFILVIVALGGYYLATIILRPINRMALLASNVNIQDEKTYMPIRGSQDEFDQLAERFNKLFHDLSNSYKRIAQFTQDAAHELRIPLTSLKGEAQILLERERSIEEYQNVLESNIEEYDHLSKMLNDLLTLSRSDTMNLNMPREKLNLSATVIKLIEFFHYVADVKSITIEQDIKPDVFVLGNAFMLERLISNLLDNAVKYSHEKRKIVVRLKQDDDHVSLEIADQGIGIPKEDLEKIFDRFYRVEQSRAKDRGGVGLGLSLVKMIADTHKAKISVWSEEKTGTRFTITFPAYRS